MTQNLNIYEITQEEIQIRWKMNSKHRKKTKTNKNRFIKAQKYIKYIVCREQTNQL